MKPREMTTKQQLVDALIIDIKHQIENEKNYYGVLEDVLNDLPLSTLLDYLDIGTDYPVK